MFLFKYLQKVLLETHTQEKREKHKKIYTAKSTPDLSRIITI